MSKKIPELYGSLVFGDRVMREKLPKEVYRALRKTIEENRPLGLEVANAVAVAMKEWAVEHGATHYTHWFQPMTGNTAEKHDSFLTPIGHGEVIMDFSGKELIKGEPDASSFPSGGLRATFEARGYTAWDPTSPAFIKDGTLYIPTAFCSYSGEALDKKTPLLRSMETLSKEAVKVLHLLGSTDVKSVLTTIGPEQEYFLVDKDLYAKRRDLLFTGRTLLGAMAPKGQEMEDHYFGTLKSRVSAYMHELDEELWKLGVPAKTKHNEVAPAQHELAPVFDTANIAVDHNQLTMETPRENIQFLVFLVAVIKAVDDYADLLRVSVASAGNDHRLGANEAPPAIVSIFLGDELTEVLDSIENGTFLAKREAVPMEIGAAVIPRFFKDTTDRNRTSPFAFTGNKFEFRMLGSEISVSGPNIVLNTAVAQVLRGFYEELKDTSESERSEAVYDLLKRTVTQHKRVIFNGNGYTDEWVEEAEKRGLYNLKATPDALPHFIDEKNVKLFTDHHIFTREEMVSRYVILLEGYSKTLHVEAKAMLSMLHHDFLPAAERYIAQLVSVIQGKTGVDPALTSTAERKRLTKINELVQAVYEGADVLAEHLEKAEGISDPLEQAKYYQQVILQDMQDIRTPADEAEGYLPQELLPYPNYEALLFSV